MVRKNNSRRSDRNQIFKMHQQGYVISQIEAKLSITQEHITYVLTQYDKDLKQKRADSPELQDRAKTQAEVENRRHLNKPLNPPERQEMKDELRKEVMAELVAAGVVVPPVAVEPEPEPEIVVTLQPEPETDEDTNIVAPVVEAKTRPKRKRKAA